jgi:alpha-amylase/alpha-mannosidase (GH57 family)
VTGDGQVPRSSICIHGHFYQPPRENPWLGVIERQESAEPYHDWNERITAECYRPNAAARILDESGNEMAASNNYARISFDFGPTLLSWLEQAAPDVYAAVQAADRVAHGAVAQAYNHMILPLANARDRSTQVIWGSRDFAHRFGREPEGMWLPETAVDLDTLEDLASAGIQFTILAPRQAHRVRRFGSSRWQDVSGGRIDPRFAYQVRLPSERHIAVFFYDAELSQAVAFEGLLNDGRALAQRLASAIDGRRREPQLVSIATDGESYGHHHRFGEMALAAALRLLDQRPEVLLTNYRAFLATHPPAREVEIVENSSWSCVHGVERWRADCGCNTGGFPAWHQAWRGPLRAALDWLRDQLAPAYQLAALKLVWNPWAARNDYVDVLLDRSPAAASAFLRHHARRELAPPELDRLWNLMEMQRFAMFMYTSCGWFFDDISGIEASQILAYAARAVELAAACLDLNLEPGLLRRLALARGNVPHLPDGRAVYLEQVRRRPAAPAAVT